VRSTCRSKRAETLNEGKRMRKHTLLLTIAVVIVAGIAAFGWVTIRRGFSARDKPSAMEAYMAKTARKLAIPASIHKTSRTGKSTTLFTTASDSRECLHGVARTTVVVLMSP